MSKKPQSSPPRIDIYEGHEYIISLDNSKPNQHFQTFMKHHIGKKVRIRRIGQVDEYGYKVVFVHGELSHICWREYDFVHQHQQHKESQQGLLSILDKSELKELFTI